MNLHVENHKGCMHTYYTYTNYLNTLRSLVRSQDIRSIDISVFNEFKVWGPDQ